MKSHKMQKVQRRLGHFSSTSGDQ